MSLFFSYSQKGWAYWGECVIKDMQIVKVKTISNDNFIKCMQLWNNMGKIILRPVKLYSCEIENIFGKSFSVKTSFFVFCHCLSVAKSTLKQLFACFEDNLKRMENKRYT